MKTKTYFLVMLLTVSSMTLNATDKKDNEEQSALEVVKQGDIFKLFYVKKDIDKVNIRIINNKGKILFRETIKNEDGFIRPYNFDKLAHGEYRIIVSDMEESVEKTVHHGKVDLLNVQPAYQLVKVKEMTEMDNVYRLTIVNQGEALAEIKVKNKNDKVIYSLTESFSGNYAKLFNLGKIKEHALIEVTLAGETTTFDL